MLLHNTTWPCRVSPGFCTIGPSSYAVVRPIYTTMMHSSTLFSLALDIVNKLLYKLLFFNKHFVYIKSRNIVAVQCVCHQAGIFICWTWGAQSGDYDFYYLNVNMIFSFNNFIVYKFPWTVGTVEVLWIKRNTVGISHIPKFWDGERADLEILTDLHAFSPSDYGRAFRGMSSVCLSVYVCMYVRLASSWTVGQILLIFSIK
jgi:hypothetical protein